MAKPDDQSPASPDEQGGSVSQGEPTYAPKDVSDGARRSLLREEQRYEDTGWLARRTLGAHEPADEIGPSVGTTGQGQYGPGGFPDGGYGQSGYGGDSGQLQHGHDSFGGEEQGRSGGQGAATPESKTETPGDTPAEPD